MEIGSVETNLDRKNTKLEGGKEITTVLGGVDVALLAFRYRFLVLPCLFNALFGLLFFPHPTLLDWSLFGNWVNMSVNPLTRWGGRRLALDLKSRVIEGPRNMFSQEMSSLERR